MDLKALKDTPPWDWPAGMAEKLANVLRDQQATESDRLLAMLRDSGESKQVRARGFAV